MLKNAIVLCSGGLDSVTTAHYIKKELGYDKLKILFFNYGQRALKQERNASKNCARDLNGEFMEIDVRLLGKISNSLINKKGSIKKLTKKDLKDTKKESQKFYVPCRNTVFLVYALAVAESEFVKNGKTSEIFVGFKCEGAESYPDTTIRFVKEINNLSKISCSSFFKINAPLIKKDKEEIVRLALKLGVNFRETFSCYSPKKEKHCGYCLACKLRQAGFYWAGIEDSTKYSLK